MEMYKALFGNAVAERCLLYIANYGEGYIRGIAETFDLYPSQVKLQLERLEAGDILISQYAGQTKLFKINPRLAIRDELTSLLMRILSLIPREETERYFRARRRPRKTGKAL